jgi:hypothetical protein
MRVTVQGDTFVFRDSPGCFWLFGGFFLLVGGLAILASASSTGTGYPLWQVLGGIALGVSAVAAGVYLIYDSPVSQVTADRRKGTLILRRQGLLRRQRQVLPLSSVRDVYVIEGKDIDGDPVFSSRIALADGVEVPLTLIWLNDRRSIEDAAHRLKQFIAGEPGRGTGMTGLSQ